MEKNERLIHVKLLNEGTDVWRPVVAKVLRGDLFQLPLAQEDPEEQWEFRPGSIVRCELVELSEGPTLAAVRADDYFPVYLAAEAERDPMMARVAESFRENGTDVADAVLADFFPDGTSLFFGLLVTPTGTVSRFVFDYLHMDASRGRVKRCEDITSFWQTTPYGRQIAPALRLAGAAR